VHHCWESSPMNREFRLTLCLAALCALPPAATAQGIARPGVADPRAKDNNDDRRDRFSLPHMLLHVPHGPAGASEPDFSPNEPTPGGPRPGTGFGPTPRPSPSDPPRPPGNYEPATADAFRPPIRPEAFAPPRFSEPPRCPIALEHPTVGEGGVGIVRGLSGGRGGIFAGIGGAIAAAFGGIFGRKKES
jgi:hypothetical protein